MHKPVAKKVTISTDVQILYHGGGQFSLLGGVDFDNAGQVMSEGQKLFADHDSIVVDTSAAEVQSTAGLAVMMEWASWCEIRDKDLAYEGIHSTALAVAELNGVTMMIPISTKAASSTKQNSVSEILS